MGGTLRRIPAPVAVRGMGLCVPQGGERPPQMGGAALGVGPVEALKDGPPSGNRVHGACDGHRQSDEQWGPPRGCAV